MNYVSTLTVLSFIYKSRINLILRWYLIYCTVFTLVPYLLYRFTKYDLYFMNKYMFIFSSIHAFIQLYIFKISFISRDDIKL